MNNPQIRAGVIAVVGAIVVSGLLFAANGANPFEAFQVLLDGSLGGTSAISGTLTVWVPLALAAASLVVTFSAGLWNIGVEGQIIVGAVGATWAAREVPGPGWLVIIVAIIAGMIAGGLWGLFTGLLKVYGGVNEIFGGLGLFFVATGWVTYLIIGPWKRAGVASTSGTDLFREEVWFPEFGSFSTSWVSLLLALIAVVGVWVLMRGTTYGLRLKAVGSNLRAAARLGVPSNRYMLSAFVVAGAIAGTAGTVQALGKFHKLVPSISGGFGFLGILVVLLAAYRASLAPWIAFFFAAISVGVTSLELRLGLDSSISGVLQGLLVLFVLFAAAWQRRQRERAEARAVSESVAAESAAAGG